MKSELNRSKNEPWEIVCFSDSEYGGNPVTIRGISGVVLYVLGVPLSWQSKRQISITLTSSEAEWVVLSETLKEVMFVVKLLQSMKISV